MTENKEVNMEKNEKRSDDFVDPTHILLKNLHDLMVKNQDEQKKFNEKVLKNQRLTAEKMNKLSEEQQKIIVSIDRKPNGTEKISFVLKHVFDKVSSMEESKEYYSEEEEHFGVPWQINVSREGEWLTFGLFCPKSLNDRKWSIKTKFELKLISKSGNHVTKKINQTFGNANRNRKYDAHGEMEFIKWEKLKEDYVNDDKITTEIHVHITKMTRIYNDTEESFVLKHVFNNVSSMEEKKECFSEVEEQFGVPWQINVSRKDNWLTFHLLCDKSLEDEKWLIETKFELKLISKNGNHVTNEMNHSFGNANGNVFIGFGRMKFIEWEKLEKDYVDDDKITTEIHVNITKITGIYKVDLRTFDESKAKFSDVILIVKERKFYVLKMFLAANSRYFESLFLGKFQESGKSEIKLSGIDVDDFQKYLEVLYGEYAIDATTVEGILLVADMYDTPIVIKKCEEFLMNTSKMTSKKKREMAARYNLGELKKKCMSETKTIADIE